MGEKIRVIDQINFAGGQFEIELNKATTLNGPRYIHMQNDKIRLSFTEEEFIKILSSINLAAYKIKKMKDIE